MSVCRSILSGIQGFYDANKYTDVTVQVGDQTFYCHRIVLSAVSKFFDAMYSSGMRESKEDRVCLKDISPSVFKLILSYVYKDSDIVTEHNAEELFKTSAMLQIDCLQEKCENFMGEKINAENCLGIWKLARAFHNKSLEFLCMSFILNNFEDIRHNEEFVRLEAEELGSIIGDDDLVVVREESVCEALIRWVTADEERHPSIETLFPCLRLSLVDLNYILDELDPLPMVQTNAACVRLVRQAVRLHAVPSRRNELGYLIEQQRNCLDKETVLTVIGRRVTGTGDRIMEFIGYSCAHQKWFSFHPAPPDVGDEFATCCHGDDLFITGGTNKLNSCYYYSPKLSRWRSRSPMRVGRYRHCMASVKGVLYVLGGYNAETLKSVEEYDIRNDTWRTVGDLHTGIDASSAVVLGNNIYMFGGWLGCAEETSAIQCFNTNTYTCTLVGHLPSSSKFTRAVVCENRVEVLCSEGKLVSFSENESTKMIGKISSFGRKNYGMIRDNRNNKTTLVLGGENTYQLHQTSGEEEHHRDIYTVTGSTVSVCDSLQFPTNMEVNGCFYTVMNKCDFHADFEKMLVEFDV